MKSISVREFQLHATQYLKEIPLVLTQYGKPVAKLVEVGLLIPSGYASKAEFFRNKKVQLEEKLQEKPEFPKTMDQPTNPIESVKEPWGTQPIPCRICHSTPTANWMVEYDGTVDYVPLCKTHYEEQVRKVEKLDYTGIRVSRRVAGENVYFHPIPKPKKKK